MADRAVLSEGESSMVSWRAELARERVRGGARHVVALFRVLAGVVFVLTSLGKFTAGEVYVALFESYGLPGSPALVLLTGTVELIGGILLVVGLGTRLVAVVLAGTMVVAIATAGVAIGGPVHLGLAPTLLLVLVLLLWAGPGAASLDGRLLGRAGPGRPARA
ncbi:DoxX family protein [Actinomycetospora straminea]|uniref:Oxidoreductase n=1 Tax=Actinomycetospora straminea TaxID=663607 RepID=A0ABP9FAA2_9PSEU|nr:DoxX family protein [Actinomycetospora straminea]MDD7934079.1 DoxX family protein [Actinomycetospora straminea]